MNLVSILQMLLAIYEEMAKGGAKAEADKLLGHALPIIAAVAAATTPPPPVP